MNDITNLQLLCEQCNLRKGSKTITPDTHYESWYSLPMTTLISPPAIAGRAVLATEVHLIMRPGLQAAIFGVILFSLWIENTTAMRFDFARKYSVKITGLLLVMLLASPATAQNFNYVAICNDEPHQLHAATLTFVEYLFKTNGNAVGWTTINPGDCRNVHMETNPSTVNVGFMRQDGDGTVPVAYTIGKYDKFDGIRFLKSFCVSYEGFGERGAEESMRQKYTPPCPSGTVELPTSISVRAQGFITLQVSLGGSQSSSDSQPRAGDKSLKAVVEALNKVNSPSTGKSTALRTSCLERYPPKTCDCVLSRLEPLSTAERSALEKDFYNGLGVYATNPRRQRTLQGC